MKPGSHAAADGSFGRSAGIQLGRAVALIAVAVLLGLFLLHRTGPANSGPPALAAATSTTQTTAPPTSAAATTSSSVATKTPQAVKVLVANGTPTAGVASRLSTRLKGQGYDTVGAGTNASQAATTSKVYYQPGFAAEAATLAQLLKLPPSAAQPMPSPAPVNNLGSANVVVVAGPDLASGSSGTGGGSTPTTRSSSSTTHVTG
jgi:hypothetical protein